MASHLSPPQSGRASLRRFSSSSAVGRPKFSRARVRRSRNRHRGQRPSTTSSPDPADRKYEHALSSTSHLTDDDGDNYDDESDQERPAEPVHRGRLMSHPVLDLQHSYTDAFEDGRRPLTYSSLPSTPVAPDAPPLSAVPQSPLSPISMSAVEDAPAPFSLWDYLREELLATDFDSHQEMKWERVSNFLNVPVAIEKVRLSLISLASGAHITIACRRLASPEYTTFHLFF